jgi:hypothetical protein
VKNLQEHPQSVLLTDSIEPILQKLHPDAQYCIGQYELMPANERGHYPIEPMDVELGIWQGLYQNLELPWLRWWDKQGNLLVTGWEQSQILEARSQRLAAKLKELGVNPEELG